MLPLTQKHRKKMDIALVLASGGAKGFAHIGAIQELERRGHRITSVAGTSMGALIGGLYAAGGLEKAAQWFYELDNKKIWSLLDFTWSISSFVKGDKLIEAMKEVVPDVNIEDLPIPFCAITTDLKTGEEVVIREGSLYNAIRASISLPVIFTQVATEDRILVDGGLVNGLPLNRVARNPGDKLVAINLDDYEWHDPEEVKVEGRFPKVRSKLNALANNHVNLLRRSLTVAIRQNILLSLQLNKPDIYLNIDLADYGSYDYDKAREIAKLGQQQMASLLEEGMLKSL